jgi:hypothetical protein
MQRTLGTPRYFLPDSRRVCNPNVNPFLGRGAQAVNENGRGEFSDTLSVPKFKVLSCRGGPIRRA